MFSVAHLRPLLFGSLLLAGLALPACSKKADPIPELTEAQRIITGFIGRWELAKYYGGIGGITYFADPARKQELLITADGQISDLVNGIIVHTRPYQVLQRISPRTNQPETYLIASAGSTGQISIIQNSAHMLVATDDYISDGYTYEYVRR